MYFKGLFGFKYLRENPSIHSRKVIGRVSIRSESAPAMMKGNGMQTRSFCYVDDMIKMMESKDGLRKTMCYFMDKL